MTRFYFRKLGGRYGIGEDGQDFTRRPVPLLFLQPSLPTHRRGYAHGRARLSRYDDDDLIFSTLKLILTSFCVGLDLRLDILDTGGSYVFPAMRSLAITSADGFVLVCAVNDPASLEVTLKMHQQYNGGVGQQGPFE